MASIFSIISLALVIVLIAACAQRNALWQKKKNGIFRCKRPNCEICISYLQECTSFVTSNGKEWSVRTHITCRSKNVVYYLKCLSCDEATTYAGQTNNLRKRINNHISECKSGKTSDIFDKHVFVCNKQQRIPSFKLYVFLEVFDNSLLDSYENYIHRNRHDTMNRGT